MSGGQEEKNKSSGYWFTLIGFLICIIMSVIISIYGFYIYSKVSEYDHSVDELISNWKSNPIVDIQISNSTCPAGYEALITGGWPGTVEGCECSKSWNPLFKGLSRNQWANADSKNGWFKILPQKPIDCQKFYSYTIWGKREGQNFINTKRPSGSGANTTCPTGYKVWGKGNVNTNYWTSTNSSCPITDIYIGNPNSTVQPGYKALPLGNGRYAAFKSEGNDLPIVRFKITEGNVCVDPYQQMKSENRTIYKLMNDTYGEWEAKVAGNSTDPQYVQIGSIKENILFDDNNVTNVIKNLPNYPVNDSAKYDWNLFYARYFQWNVEWEIKHNIDRKEMAELIDNSDDIPDLQWKTLFLIGLQVNSLIFKFYFIIKTSKNNHPKLNSLGDNGIICDGNSWNIYCMLLTFLKVTLYLILAQFNLNI